MTTATDGPGLGSLWAATLPSDARTTGAPLEGDLDVDVVIVGAGYTGLWTAYSLAGADPHLRIAVLERDRIGFGASGRNGGWCSALLATGLTGLAERHGRAAAIATSRALQATVDEVAAVIAEEGIDAHWEKGGTVTLARTDAQQSRLTAEIAEARAFGFGDDDLRWLAADEWGDRCRATRTQAALYTPHCAVVHPLRLAHGVAAAAQRRGVRIHEATAVTDLSPRRVTTDRGTVRADVVVVATEAYTVQFADRRRDVVPLYSLMVATEPLSAEHWDAIGLASRPSFADARHSIVYGQRTADDRLAFGGRGAPYHFGSRIDPRFDTDERVRALLIATVRDLFPVLADVGFPYHWGGPLAVPRDWHCSVGFDQRTGLAHAGGYVGDGVSTTNLAGRILADLITGRDSDLTHLPLVDHRSRRWEPEPLRWLGVNLGRHAATRADAAESADGRVAATRAKGWSRVLRTLTGH